MTIDLRAHRGRRWILIVGAVVCASALTAGCSESGSAEQLNANSPVLITTQASAVVIQNKAGMPLTDIKVTVVAFGKEYSSSVGRLESEEGRRVSLAVLSSADRATFNPAFARPKLVRVQATDAAGKSFEVETSWK